jgi:hypothetical protein
VGRFAPRRLQLQRWLLTLWQVPDEVLVLRIMTHRQAMHGSRTVKRQNETSYIEGDVCVCVCVCVCLCLWRGVINQATLLLSKGKLLSFSLPWDGYSIIAEAVTFLSLSPDVDTGFGPALAMLFSYWTWPTASYSHEGSKLFWNRRCNCLKRWW